MNYPFKILTTISKDDIIYHYKDESGAMYSKDGIKLLKAAPSEKYFPDDIMTSDVEIVIKIKEGTQIICDNAFEGLSYYVTELYLPNTIRYIGDYAFSDLLLRNRFELPFNCRYIGKYAFSGCNLTSIVIHSEKLIVDIDTFSFSQIEKLFVPQCCIENYRNMINNPNISICCLNA